MAKAHIADPDSAAAELDEVRVTASADVIIHVE